MPHKVAVVIPVYKDELNEFEKISLAQVQKVLSNYQIIFVAPQGKNFSYFTQDCKVYLFPPQFFQSTMTYNVLMKLPNFYEAFLDYEYILIYQLDAFVFSDELEYFCGLGYDYIGAPWEAFRVLFFGENKYRLHVGNGGFSLRKIDACYNLLMNHKDFDTEDPTLPEDIFFSLCGELFKKEFHVAPINIACKFSIENLNEHFVNKNGGKLPFGCHAWQYFNTDFVMKNFSKFGYDLKNLPAYTFNAADNAFRFSLMNLAMSRLQRRLQRGQSIMRYLANKNFASIRVIRHNFALIILSRLMLENNHISDKIILYDEDEKDILIQDLKLERTPHLIITAGGNFEDALIDEITQRGISYGKRVVSFNKEYLSYCEKLFHNLGK